VKEITLKYGDKSLQATLHGDDLACGVVLCPPHPMYGGNRKDVRLTTIAHELAKANISALCVDYERYTGGREEVEDILSALSYMKERVNGLGLVGYSYGAVVASNAVSMLLEIEGLVLISPLKKVNGLRLKPNLACPKLLIYGLHDPFIASDIDEICSNFEGQKLTLETDHFYLGYEEVIARAVREFFCEVFCLKRET
jgi:hypothetical protein